VRMSHRLLGEEGFRRGSDLYFERHDGQAVTTDDFVRAMEDATGRDLTQFRRWYDQAGTPHLEVTDAHDPETQVYTLTVRQWCPKTPGQPDKKPFHIPFAVGLLDGKGQPLPLPMEGAEGAPLTRVLELREPEHRFEFTGIPERPVPSLLRDFSAPVKLAYPWTREQLAFLMGRDPDGFNRWDAGQQLAGDVIRALYEGRETRVDAALVNAYRTLLTDTDLDQALVAKMLALPSLSYLIEQTPEADVPRLHRARAQVLETLAEALRDELLQCIERHPPQEAYALDPQAIAGRSLRNTALAWLLRFDDRQALGLATGQFERADNMTDRIGALSAIAESGYTADRERMLADFYHRWRADPQVVEQWFALQSGSERQGGLETVRALLGHPAFDWKNPNKIRAVIGVFAARNLLHFHTPDGCGYAFLADQILRLDGSNPQVAARLCGPLTGWRKFAPQASQHMREQLQRIKAEPRLSRDVFEVVSKSLGGE